MNIFTNIYGVGPKTANEFIKKGITTLESLKNNTNILNDKQKVGLKYYDDIIQRIPRNEIDDFYEKSDIMQEYFSHVITSERKLFGETRFLPSNVSQILIRMGDLNLISHDVFGEALDSDIFIVFGASFIKGPLCEFLVSRGCLNIHMGISPYYRGTATNFWPLFEGAPEFVGATIHLLTKGLDSGPILFHALPPAIPVSAFDLGMKAVFAAQQGLRQHVVEGTLAGLSAERQDRTLERRYTRRNEFTDETARVYLDSMMSENEILKHLASRDLSLFKDPYIGS